MLEKFLSLSVFFYALCVLLLFSLLYRIIRNPFTYPYYIHFFDVTSKRNVKFEDYIDNFLCDPWNWQELSLHEKKINQWKSDSEEYIQGCLLRKHRKKQYLKVLDDQHAYRFKMTRQQTRYKQVYYQKTSYKVSVVDSGWSVNWEWLWERYVQLEQIDFATTLNDYNSKEQRKLMTPTLRKKIMQRDCYTCQICGKYMPDEVGLHIDHIFPIAKGGKSIPSNLRVLCSKCNGNKGSK